jgi:hypothetical protein
MTGMTKRKTLVLLGLVILITMMIAANLTQLEFQPGMPIPKLQGGQLVALPSEEDQFVSISANRFVLVLIILLFAVALLITMYQLLRGADWKLISDFLRYMLVISVITISILFLITLFPGSDSYTPSVIAFQTPSPAVTSPLGSAPPSILWLVGIGLLLISVLVVMWIITASQQVNPIDVVGLEAEKARQALRSGMDFKDVIINCYHQMSLALKQEQGIERKSFMTTGEFENLLETAGIPHKPIHQLTQLFDAVRYGNWQSNATDEQTAQQCLEAIIHHSRDARGKN